MQQTTVKLDVKIKSTSSKLNLNELVVEHRSDGQLWANRNGKSVAIHVLRCFPWSTPDRYVSLRDDDDNEVALVGRLSELNSDSRKVVEAELAIAGFILEIVGVESITEDFEIRSWNVNTAQGSRKFQTKLDEWPLQVPGGGLLIRDVADDLFYLPEPDALDEKSQYLIKSFVD